MAIGCSFFAVYFSLYPLYALRYTFRLHPVRKFKALMNIPARIFQNIRSLCSSKPHRNSLTGFTMVEIVVMLAILVMVSTIVLANFTGFNERSAIVRGAQELALELRRTQNLTLAVGRVQLQNGNFYNGTALGGSLASATSPKAAGIHFDKSPGNNKIYLAFIDVPSPNLLYDGSADAAVATKTFERGIYISKLYVDGTCGTAEFTTADIIFQSPDAALAINGDGASIIASCSFLKIELKSPSLNLTETVTARITGQISVQ